MKVLKQPIVKKKKYTRFKPFILSRHPTHNHLRSDLGLFPIKSVIRLGSTTSLRDPATLSGNRIEVNSVQSIKNSASKLLMKQCFTRDNVKTADWWTLGTDKINFFINDKPAVADTTPNTSGNLPYPLIVKHIFGSRGTGITLIESEENLKRFISNRNMNNYIIEKYYNYTREYRIHVTKDGYFYTCRKMLKSDIPDNKRHIRNDSTCIWIKEDNESFDKPANWDTIIKECVKALNAVGLDIGGFDVRVQSSKDKKGKLRKETDFIIIESNSACSHGELTAIKYKEALIKVLNNKATEWKQKYQ